MGRRCVGGRTEIGWDAEAEPGHGPGRAMEKLGDRYAFGNRKQEEITFERLESKGVIGRRTEIKKAAEGEVEGKGEGERDERERERERQRRETERESVAVKKREGVENMEGHT